MKITEDAPIEVEVSRSTIDGALLVQVDTTGDTGRLRIFVNDGAVFDRDPDVDDHPLASVLGDYDREMHRFRELSDVPGESVLTAHYKTLVGIADRMAADIRKEVTA